ncbi:MAG: CPBP family intramembrane metalloprotease [Kineosporiaceae bacterium]|nr:CPBP family intramembrane metalloprotease [Kineosporiaceae bacterium]MBK7624263.1 CPBP family intramembrane metalloprotease [Kineosporiaceae bacterium]MBK8075265.1 CPBP family intramembrane metalloprotease [Kineosporiaceae bacterium]
MAAIMREGYDRRSTPAAVLLLTHPVAAFFVLAYLLSWVYWLFVLGIMGRDTLAWFIPGAFGPPLAALIVTGLLEGRAGTRAFLRRWVQWRVGARWYVLALVGLPALGLLVGLLSRDWSERFAGSGPSVAVTYLATLSLVAVLGGGQEEPGWRGFALPRMQERMGPLAASVVLGVLWGLWHLPVFILVPGYNFAGAGVASIAGSVVVFTAAGTVGQSLLLTWLFNHTGGSVLLAVLAHASLNAGTALVAGRTASMAVDVLFGVVGVVLVLATRGTLSYQSAGHSGGTGAADSRPGAGVRLRTTAQR